MRLENIICNSAHSSFTFILIINYIIIFKEHNSLSHLLCELYEPSPHYIHMAEEQNIDSCESPDKSFPLILWSKINSIQTSKFAYQSVLLSASSIYIRILKNRFQFSFQFCLQFCQYRCASFRVVWSWLTSPISSMWVLFSVSVIRRIKFSWHIAPRYVLAMHAILAHLGGWKWWLLVNCDIK